MPWSCWGTVSQRRRLACIHSQLKADETPALLQQRISPTGTAISEREWLCGCGAKHKRDLNAAVNIRNMGLNKYTSGIGVEACGQNVSLVSASSSG